jgi:hypothetical protein
MTSLRIIRANNNQINTIPFLKHIRHLELAHNPIQRITSKLAQTRIQFLKFDWVPFLISCKLESTSEETVYALCDIIEEANINPMDQFVGFDVLFEHRRLDCQDISYPLHKAVFNREDFFIDYLLTFKNTINYNSLHYNDKPVLVEVLEQGYDKAIELFKLRKSNVADPEVFMSNLILVIKFGHLDLYDYLIAAGIKYGTIAGHEDEILETIFMAFDNERNSLEMLGRMLEYTNCSPINKKVFRLPPHCTIMEEEKVCDGVLAVLNST